jgi:DNA-binding NtrC family response regulator
MRKYEAGAYCRKKELSMAKKKRAVLTYNGVDGACAAAVVLLRYPAAEVWVTSANRADETLREMDAHTFSEVHVCGLGVWCAWESFAAAAAALRKKGTEIVWYCGRGYLDRERLTFEKVSTPVFLAAESNTAAVAAHLRLADNERARYLISLSALDRHVAGARPGGDIRRDHSDWLDLIGAALAQYLKFQDHAPYITAIRKLAMDQCDEQALRAVATFRRNGMKYILHGRSPLMRSLRDRIRKIAKIDRHLIITGESGTGKEHVAQLIREGSGREQGPFIPVNCALYAGNAGLANSDLFGHVKGAFTGAVETRRGRFAEADTGILYLDEIGDLPLEVQGKLLRVIEDGQVTPEGADAPRLQVSVRIIAAANRNLPAMVRKGKFRADLYHRLSTLRIHVPPLRERHEDVKIITDERLNMLAEEGYRKPRLTKKDRQRLAAYRWPGNVRQLVKIIDRAVMLGIGVNEALEEEEALGELEAWPDDAPETPDRLMPRSPDEVLTIDALHYRYAKHVLALFGGNKTAAAEALGIRPNTLRYSYLKEEKA